MDKIQRVYFTCNIGNNINFVINENGYIDLTPDGQDPCPDHTITEGTQYCGGCEHLEAHIDMGPAA